MGWWLRDPEVAWGKLHRRGGAGHPLHHRLNRDDAGLVPHNPSTSVGNSFRRVPLGLKGGNMRRVGTALLFLLFSVNALADLQNVRVGGSVEIYGAWYSEFFEGHPDGAVPFPSDLMQKRTIGPYGTQTWIRADDHGHNLRFAEQRTRLNFLADFTDRVHAFIELDSIDAWGQDFRSDYRTGADSAADTSDDLEVFQSYIEAQDMGGWPLTLRLGRQEMSFGSGWLVGTNPDPDPFTGLSFDGLRLTWTQGPFTLDAWWSKLAENGAAEEDGDVDFYGVYATYLCTPDIAVDAYWMLLRDARAFNDTDYLWPAEWLEDALGLDDYDPTALHTVGARTAGTYGPLDWEVEAAFQFGQADSVGALFRITQYGDDDADWNGWAGHGEVGYSFDTRWSPRVYVGGSYYSGEDDRGVTFWEWLNPYGRADASVSFNRLFSDTEVDAFLCGSALSNFWEWHAGATFSPTDALQVGVSLMYEEINEDFDHPLCVRFRDYQIGLLPDYPFITHAGAKDLGWQASLTAAYAYTKDLNFEVGYVHYFVGDAINDGAFVDENGLRFIGGRGDQDADYIYGLTTIKF